jgi:hypothetical protein
MKVRKKRVKTPLYATNEKRVIYEDGADVK